MALTLFGAWVLSACSSDDEVDDAPTQIEEAAKPIAITPKPKGPTHIYIGTGSVQGAYFPIGGVICRLVNRQTAKHNIRCTLESTGGSVNNLVELKSGLFDIVVAQSDWQYHAYNGTRTFEKYGPNQNLRSVFALEADPLALIVKENSDIQQVDDLANRVVSFGYSRSIQHRLMDDYLAAKEWTEEMFEAVVAMSDAKQVSSLCNDEVEAIVLLSSALDFAMSTLPRGCNLRMVSIDDSAVEKVIAQYPYYRKGIIPSSMNLGSPDDIRSFGLGATFVAMESTSPKAVYHVVKEITENFKDFQSLHPSLQMISRAELPTAGLTAPLHPGARRYYEEAGLVD